MNNMRYEYFDTTLEALDFQDVLSKDKIKSNLTHQHTENFEKVEWIVSWVGPRTKKAKVK